jgi:hypothetical protein
MDAVNTSSGAKDQEASETPAGLSYDPCWKGEPSPSRKQAVDTRHGQVLMIRGLTLPNYIVVPMGVEVGPNHSDEHFTNKALPRECTK